MKEQEEVLKMEAENDLIWVDEFEFDLDDIDKARVLRTDPPFLDQNDLLSAVRRTLNKAEIDDFATELFPENDPDLPPRASYESDLPNFSFE